MCNVCVMYVCICNVCTYACMRKCMHAYVRVIYVLKFLVTMSVVWVYCHYQGEKRGVMVSHIIRSIKYTNG